MSVFFLRKRGTHKPFPSLLIYLTEKFLHTGEAPPGERPTQHLRVAASNLFWFFLLACKTPKPSAHHPCAAAHVKNSLWLWQRHTYPQDPESWSPLYLFSHWAVAFEEILAHFCLPGHVDVAVRAVAVAADPLQEVGAHRHLQGQTMRNLLVFPPAHD